MLYNVRVFCAGREYSFSYASAAAAMADALDVARAMQGHILGGLRRRVLSVVPCLPIY